VDPTLVIAVGCLGAELRTWSGYGRHRVGVDERVLTERFAVFPRPPPPGVSRNGTCRLFATRDGWVAVNLPRAEDLGMVPALLGEDGEGEPWARLADALPRRSAAALGQQAALLGLAVSVLGEATPAEPAQVPASSARARAWRVAPRVVDLSTLWAGPLCGALLAEAGCEVIRIESLRRPDRTAETQPAFHARLNGAKRLVPLDLSSAEGRDALATLVRDTDVVITNARPRGLASIGLPDALGDEVIHVAITAHGLEEPGADRIGFGDDCAVAGGLVDFDRDGVPSFVADAVADPLTGVSAAVRALRALALRECGTLDVSLAATAARVARLRRQHA
jgi:hypothetical protein